MTCFLTLRTRCEQMAMDLVLNQDPATYSKQKSVMATQDLSNC